MKSNNFALIIGIISIMIITSFIGCSSDNTNNQSNNIPNKEKDSSGNIIEPSELISKKEAEILLNENLKDGEISGQKAVGLKLCLYNPEDNNSTKSLQIGLTQISDMPKNVLDSGQSPKKIYESIKENFSDTLTKVDGIGDEAFIATGGIYIMSGEYYITIMVGNISNEENINILKEAGKIAVGNLK